MKMSSWKGELSGPSAPHTSLVSGPRDHSLNSRCQQEGWGGMVAVGYMSDVPPVPEHGLALCT